jgi:hypothetical protein
VSRCIEVTGEERRGMRLCARDGMTYVAAVRFLVRSAVELGSVLQPACLVSLQ